MYCTDIQLYIQNLSTISLSNASANVAVATLFYVDFSPKTLAMQSRSSRIPDHSS